MSQTVIGLRHNICTAADNQKLRNNSWSAFFHDLFSVNDVMDMNYQKDEQRLIDYLQNSCKALTQLFKVWYTLELFYEFFLICQKIPQGIGLFDSIAFVHRQIFPHFRFCINRNQILDNISREKL